MDHDHTMRVRATEAEKAATIRHILLWMKLTQWWKVQHQWKDRRWSLSTLYLTQNWAFADRCELWVRVLCADPEASRSPNHNQVTETIVFDLRSRIEKYGNDGGLSGQ